MLSYSHYPSLYLKYKANTSTIYVTSCNVVWLKLPPAYHIFNAFAFFHCWLLICTTSFSHFSFKMKMVIVTFIWLSIHNFIQEFTSSNGLLFLLFASNQSTFTKFVEENTKWIFNGNTIIWVSKPIPDVIRICKC